MSTDTPAAKPPARPLRLRLAGLEPWFLPLALLAWVLGNVPDLGHHAWVGGYRTLWHLLAPMLLLIAMPKRWPAGTPGFAMLLVLPLLAMLLPIGWVGLMANAGHPVHGTLHALALGDAAMLAAAIVCAWSAMSSAATPEHLIGRAAAAAAVTLVLAWAAVLLTPHNGDDVNALALAFGNVNDLLCMCSPPLLAGLVWGLARPDRASRAGRLFTGVMVAALTLTAWISFAAFPGRPRRGVLLAAALVGLFFAARWAWRRWPRATLAAGAAATVLAGLALAHALADFDPRNDRLLAWSAYIHQGLAHLPFGAGAEPGLRLADETSEAAQRIEASRLVFTDAHNAFIQCFAAGGVIGLGIMLALAGALAWRIARIADAAQRAAAATLGIALLVPLLTDPALTGPVGLAWAGVLVGVIARCPLVAAAPRPDGAPPLPWWRRLHEGTPGPLLCAVPLALLAVSAAAIDWRALVLSTDDGAGRRMAAIQATWQREVALGPDISNHAAILDNLAYDYAGGLDPDPDALYAADEQLSAEVNQVGFSSSLLTSAATSARLHAALARIDLTRCLAALNQDPRQARLWRRAWYDLDTIATFNASEANVLATLVRRRPFTNEGWEQLSGLLAVRPDFIVHPPLDDPDPAVRKVLEVRWAQSYLRLRYLSGDPHMPPPDLTRDPRSLSEAADLYAGLAWTLHAGDWHAVAPALEHLVRRYGECPDIGRLLLRVVSDPHAGDLPWLLDVVPRVGYGLRHNLPTDVLADITTPTGARRVWPLLHAIFPEIAARTESGAKPGPTQFEQEMARVYALSRDDGQH